MAYDAFLKIDSIDGESTDQTHQGWIEINSFQWGVGRGLAAPGGAGGAGAGGRSGPEQLGFNFVKYTDSASPQLFLKLTQGSVLKQATLACRAASANAAEGTANPDFLKITLTDVIVSSFTEAGQGANDVLPADQFSLNFSKIEFSVLNPDGKPVLADASLFYKFLK
jgi:type VI secretion system secreted protein Hcp